MTVAEFVQLCKRTQRYGDIGNTSDQVTTDIIRYLNLKAKRFWRRWPWDWSLEDISIALAVGTADYTLSANIGDIIVLVPPAGDDYLKPLSLRRYYQWYKSSGEGNGDVTNYVKLGRDGTTGGFKIRLWKTPSETGTVTGHGKKRLTTYTVADIAAGTSIGYFPDEVMDILMVGVNSLIAGAQGNKEEEFALNSSFERMMRDLIPEDTDPDEEPTSPPPDAYVWKKRKRGGTSYY